MEFVVGCNYIDKTEKIAYNGKRAYLYECVYSDNFNAILKVYVNGVFNRTKAVTADAKKYIITETTKDEDLFEYFSQLTLNELTRVQDNLNSLQDKVNILSEYIKRYRQYGIKVQKSNKEVDSCIDLISRSLKEVILTID